MSLLMRLIVLVLLAVLPAVAVGAYNVLEMRRIRGEQVHHEAIRLTRLADSEMDRIVEGTREILVTFSENPAVANGDWASCNEAAIRLLPRLDGYLNIGVTTSEGLLVCAAEPSVRWSNIYGSTSFNNAIAATQFSVGNYLVSRIGNVQALPFYQPIYGKGGERTGFVFATLRLEWLTDHFRDRFPGPDVTLAIADRAGTLLLRLPNPENWVGKNLGERYSRFVNAAQEGTAEVVGIDGVQRIIGYSPVSIEPKGIYVGVGITKSGVFGEIDRATLRGAVLIALCVALALVAAWLGGTLFIRRPIRKLLQAAGRWRQGDYGVRSSLSDPRSEITRLGRAFDDMAAQLEHREEERRAAEEQMRQFNETLEQRVVERTAELVETNRRLAEESEERRRAETALQHAQRIESIGQLTGGVAHDFNNLLTAVLGNLEIAQGRVSDGSVARLLASATRAAERGARLTQQLLAFSRRQHLQPRAVDINELVSGMSDMLTRSISAIVRIDQRLAGDLWPAMTDPSQIELVILNLAINARDAMPVGGRLVIETSNSLPGDPHRPGDLGAGDYVCIAVTDTGIGMTEEVMAKALEPFFTTKEPGKGSGLGLSMVYGVAKQSGGDIAIASRPGQGTTVRVYLPRAVTAALPESERTQGTLADQPLAGNRVLLVDDDADVRQVTALLLDDLGCEVVEGDGGADGLAIVEREAGAFDAVIADFAMPGMNGLELARAIRERWPNLPLLMITGYAEIDSTAAQEDGVSLLRKPFFRNELAEALLSLIGARASSADNVVRLRPAPRA